MLDTPGADADADGVPDVTDLDDDNDGVIDALETAPGGVDRDTDGDGLVDRLDLDSDGDALPDWQESGAVLGVDLGGIGLDGARLVGEVGANGLLDAFETAPDSGLPVFELANLDRASESARGTLPDMLDLDSDNDGLPDLVEAGVAATFDVDGDGRTDAAPGTVGADGVLDALQLEPDRSCCDVTGDGREDPLPPDTDLAGLPDPLSLDSDGDGVADLLEAGGTDVDGDGRVDDFVDLLGGRDGDREGGPDGLDDAYQLVPLVDVDTDGNGLLDRLDAGADGSGEGGDPGSAGRVDPGPPGAPAGPAPTAPAAEVPVDDVTVTFAEGVADDGVVLTGLDASGCSIGGGDDAGALVAALAVGAAAALARRRPGRTRR